MTTTHRVQACDVMKIQKTSLTEEFVQEYFIDLAHEYVETNLLSAGHSEKTLKTLELFLSAHFLCVIEERGGILEDEFGGARQLYSDIYSAGLQSTRFGQQAVLFDTSGTLVSLGLSTAKAEFRVV